MHVKLLESHEAAQSGDLAVGWFGGLVVQWLFGLQLRIAVRLKLVHEKCSTVAYSALNKYAYMCVRDMTNTIWNVTTLNY